MFTHGCSHTLVIYFVVALRVGGFTDHKFVQLTSLICDSEEVCATSQPSESLSARWKAQCMFECRHRQQSLKPCVGVNYHESNNTCDVFAANPSSLAKSVVDCQYFQVNHLNCLLAKHNISELAMRLGDGLRCT